MKGLALVVATVSGAALQLSGCSPAQTPAAEKVIQTLASGEADATKDFLQRYLTIDTTNPPGNERRAFPLLLDALEKLSLTASVTPIGADRGNVWARLAAESPDPGAKPIVLLHHIDVVGAEPREWSVPPFSGAKKDGFLFGRGAIDMKLVGALQLGALSRLVQKKARLRRDVIFLAVSDEEQGGLGAQYAVQHNLDAWDPEYLLDEGGVAVREFMNGHDIVVIATTQKRPMKIRMTALGEAGHGSRPLEDSGPNVLTRALTRILERPRPIRIIDTNVELFQRLGGLASFPKSFFLSHIDWPLVPTLLDGALSANRNMNPMVRDTLSLTIVRAGNTNNVIPAEASAVFDVRILPHTDPKELLHFLEETVDGLAVRFEVLVEPPPPAKEAPTDDPLFASLEDAVRAHMPQASVAPWTVIGATDSRFFAPRGVKCYGFNPVFLDKSQIDSIHGHDERVSLEALTEGAMVYADALERFLLR